MESYKIGEIHLGNLPFILIEGNFILETKL